MTTFSKKVVLVTGANSGIGEATAAAFAGAGATAYGTARSEKTLAEAGARHKSIYWVSLDVRDPEACLRAVEEIVKAAGRLDILVNNAGAARLLPLEATSREDIAMQFETNVYGPTYLTQAALPALRAARGSVINIGSVAGHRANKVGSLYSASKAAIEALTRAWALELAPHGIRVNAIAPGPVKTPIFGKVGLPPEAVAGLQENMSKMLPMQRIGTPEEIARWVMHLADPAASWVTGQVLSVDGGMSLI